MVDRLRLCKQHDIVHCTLVKSRRIVLRPELLLHEQNIHIVLYPCRLLDYHYLSETPLYAKEYKLWFWRLVLASGTVFMPSQKPLVHLNFGLVRRGKEDLSGNGLWIKGRQGPLPGSHTNHKSWDSSRDLHTTNDEAWTNSNILITYRRRQLFRLKRKKIVMKKM